MPNTIDDPKHWYDRAAEMRVIADENYAQARSSGFGTKRTSSR
jgi:hypothetical protein